MEKSNLQAQAVGAQGTGGSQDFLEGEIATAHVDRSGHFATFTLACGVIGLGPSHGGNF